MGKKRSVSVSVGVTADADAYLLNDAVATSHSPTNRSFLFLPPRHCHPREGGDRFPYPRRQRLDLPWQLLFHRRAIDFGNRGSEF